MKRGDGDVTSVPRTRTHRFLIHLYHAQTRDTAAVLSLQSASRTQRELRCCVGKGMASAIKYHRVSSDKQVNERSILPTGKELATVQQRRRAIHRMHGVIHGWAWLRRLMRRAQVFPLAGTHVHAAAHLLQGENVGV